VTGGNEGIVPQDEVRERPILFSAPMVRAILDGRKTQTRRAVKTLGADSFDAIHNANMGGPGGGQWWDGWWHGTSKINRFRCPYGVPGDVLWVRETFWAEGREWGWGETTWEDIAYAAIDGGEGEGRCRNRDWLPSANVGEWFETEDGRRVHFGPPNSTPYFSDTQECITHLYDPDERGGEPLRLRAKSGSMPSIHMPRWASRISLRITDVRVERLNDISASDALAEGMTFPEAMQWGNDPQDAFAELWRRINGEASWDANPWVWVISFQTAPTPPTGQGTLTALGNSGITK
jgi:hypothetical protein